MDSPAPSIARDAVERRVREAGWLDHRQGVLIGVSGGADSVGLTHLITPLLKATRVPTVLVHVHHGLRGRDADQDAHFVEALADRLEWPCHVERVDTPARAQAAKESLEMAARADRRRVFQACAQRYDATALMTGHNADDQLELFFIRLLRGCGVDGLAGMRAGDSESFPHGPEVIRPLLSFSRASIREWMRAQGLPFREDRSNQSLEPLRNRVRLELIPTLERIAPEGFRAPIHRMMAALAEHAQWVAEEVSTRCPAESPEHWDALPPPVRREQLARSIRALGYTPNAQNIQALLENPSTPWTVGPDARLVQDGCGVVRVVVPSPRKPPRVDGVEITLDLGAAPSPQRVAELEFHWRRHPMAASTAGGVTGIERFDADAVGERIILRHWRPGDRFHPIGLKGSMKLQDWFVNQKTPQTMRHDLWLATDAEGRIFWIQGQRISENHKLTPATTRVLEWWITPNKKGPTSEG